MEFQLPSSQEGKMRIVQELVPGKQVTLAHIIANPDPIVYKKLGLDPGIDYHRTAIGILSMSPAEIAVIARSSGCIWRAVRRCFVSALTRGKASGSCWSIYGSRAMCYRGIVRKRLTVRARSFRQNHPMSCRHIKAETAVPACVDVMKRTDPVQEANDYE